VSGDKKSDFGVSKVNSMTTVALQQALKWHEELMLYFRVHLIKTRGRNPKDSAVRFDLSKNSGVPESYLVRLAHKASEMRSLDAEVYRLLNLAHAKYVCACERIEGSAEAMRQERMNLKAKQENEDAQGHLGMAKSVGEAATAATQLGENVNVTSDGFRGLGADRQ
jgi:hypothetical protein